MAKTTYDETDHAQIEALLLGRTVTKVGADRLLLDDGTVLVLTGNEGGCACSAGDYELTELNGVNNIITKVEFVDDPSGDDFPDTAEGVYQIFVYADNAKINLARFEGSDGNGYYGTGYHLKVERPS